MTAKYYRDYLNQYEALQRIQEQRIQELNKMDSDDYGFFCDLETAKTMEYEKVEYYVVKVSTKYEVRKKQVGEKMVLPFIEEEPYCFQLENDKSSTSEKDMDNGVNKKRVSSRGCLCTLFSYLARIPRDVYYSLAVCTVTSTCVYIAMTISNNSMN